MRKRRREAKPLKRATGHRPELRTVVVFCEGKNSEPDYINGLKRLPEIAENTALRLELHPELSPWWRWQPAALPIQRWTNAGASLTSSGPRTIRTCAKLDNLPRRTLAHPAPPGPGQIHQHR